MQILKINAKGITDVGIRNPINQDRFVYRVVDTGDSQAGIFAVADGVGGLDKGEIASAIAISNVNKWWNEEFQQYFNHKEELIKSLINSFKKINRDIIYYSKENNIKSGTTLSVLLIHKDMYYIVHIGDSRIYKFTRKCERLTIDHSCVMDKVIGEKIVKKSLLTECLGVRQNINYFTSLGDIGKGDIFFLCSDGIYKTIEDKEIQRILKRNDKDLETGCEALINIAKERGETDNITAIAVKIVK